MVRRWMIGLGSLLAFLVVVYLLITRALPLVLPFVIAFLLAELIDPLVDRLEFKGKVPRSLAVLVVLILILGIITLAVTYAVSKLVTELQTIYVNLPSLYMMAMEVSSQIAERFGAVNAALPESIQTALSANLATLQHSATNTLPTLVSTLSVFKGLPSVLTDLLIASLATFFISRDRDQIGQALLKLFPSSWRPQLRQVKSEVWSSAIGWAKAQGLLVTMTMLQSMIGLAIIGSQYAVLVGLAIGVADMLPVIGPAAVFIPWILYGFIFGSKIFAVKLTVVWLFTLVVRQMLEPKLVADRMGVHPLTTLLAMYLGVHFFGALGFVVGPLVAMLLKSVVASGLLPSMDDEPPHVA